jgi:hypothetical protein
MITWEKSDGSTTGGCPLSVWLADRRVGADELADPEALGRLGCESATDRGWRLYRLPLTEGQGTVAFDPTGKLSRVVVAAAVKGRGVHLAVSGRQLTLPSTKSSVVAALGRPLER